METGIAKQVVTDKQIQTLRDCFDVVRVSGEGYIEIRRAFFYRHGQSAASVAADVKAIVPEAEMIEAREAWKPWPRSSYFIVRISRTIPA